MSSRPPPCSPASTWVSDSASMAPTWRPDTSAASGSRAGSCPAASGCTAKAVREERRSSANTVLPCTARLVGTPSKQVAACKGKQAGRHVHTCVGPAGRLQPKSYTASIIAPAAEDKQQQAHPGNELQRHPLLPQALPLHNSSLLRRWHGCRAGICQTQRLQCCCYGRKARMVNKHPAE